MAVPPNSELSRICSSPEFLAFVDKVKRDFQVVIVPNITTVPPSPGHSSEAPMECSFKFRCQRSNSDFLMTAREVLEQFLLSHNVHVYPSVVSRTHKRGDSFADAFPHFDSKVLSTARTRHQSTPSLVSLPPVLSHRPRQADSADLGRPSESMIDRRLRLASSSPDVKALFNGSPSYIYHVEEEDDYDQPNYVPGPAADQWTPLPPIVSGDRSLRHARSVLTYAPQGSQLPIRARQSEDALKRGSDSLLEAKLKDQLSKPRSLNNRAQSLDLTMSLSRITEASRLSRPDSPETSIAETGGSSPTSINMPSFPSVYASPSPVANRSAAPSVHGSIGRSGLVLDEEAVEEVSRVISNLGL
jgi:hypothetical protein